METSCGVLLFDEKNRLLLAHPTGAGHWDIPKGRQDPGETPLETAVRELYEETAQVVPPDVLTDLGCYAYRKGKHLHLFRGRLPSSALASCQCLSTFKSESGRDIPEMDDYHWATPGEVQDFASQSLLTLFARKPELLDPESPPPPLRGGLL